VPAFAVGWTEKNYLKVVVVEGGRRFRTLRAEAWEKEKRERKKGQEREGNPKGFFPPLFFFFLFV